MNAERRLVFFGAGIAALETLRATELVPELVVDGTEALWGQTLLGTPIAAPSQLEAMLRDGKARPFVVVCAYGGRSVARILDYLGSLGLRPGLDVRDSSEFLVEPMAARLTSEFAWNSNPAACGELADQMLRARIDNQSSVPGTWLLCELVRMQIARGVSGDIAEAGVFEGGNARLALQHLGDELGERNYHLFDSFEGLPAVGEHDPASRAGEFTGVVLGQLREALSPYPRVQFHAGWFANTFAAVPATTTFALAYIDCDLYEPAVECCEFFYPRLPMGGVLLFHDYWAFDAELPKGGREPFTGVRRAVDAFAKAHGETIVRFPETTHAAIVRKAN